MEKEYLQDVQLVFLKKMLLDKLDGQNLNTENDSIEFSYGSIEDYANKGINLLSLLVTLERELDIRIPLTTYFEKPGKKSIVHESLDKFLSNEGFECSHLFFDDYCYEKDSNLFGRVFSSCSWLLDTIIEIKGVASVKNKINEFLNKHISDYENGKLLGTNVLSKNMHNTFFIKLFESFKNIEQQNLLIDSDMLSNKLVNFFNSTNEAKGQMRLLEHFLLFENREYIKIKEIDFSKVDSTIPWKITIAIITPLSEIAELEKVSLQEPSEEKTENAKNTEEIKSQKSSKMPTFNEELGKVSFNGKEWTLKKKSKQFYLLKILLNQKPGDQMTIEEIKTRYYRNNEQAKKILLSNSGRWVKDLVGGINDNAMKHLEIEELLKYNGSTIELVQQ
ncbi:MAG: hypothetical protein HY094_03945 [Candidatus Melainabacteria bacterium]|nr:hypothetical protein [Candidatus Melainabacteria bacterium]